MQAILIIGVIVVCILLRIYFVHNEDSKMKSPCPVCGERVNRWTLPQCAGEVLKYHYFCKCKNVNLKTSTFYDIYNEFEEKLEEINVMRASKDLPLMNKLTNNLKDSVIENCYDNRKHQMNEPPSNSNLKK